MKKRLDFFGNVDIIIYALGARHTGGLCNGSTPDSDSVCEGSNPSPPAIKSRIAQRFGIFPKNLARHKATKFICRCSSSVEHQLPKLNRGVRLPSPAPCKSSKSLTWSFCNDIRSLRKRMIYPVGMISAAQMIYASRMMGTDIISCLRSKYIMRREPYIISRKRYIINNS